MPPPPPTACCLQAEEPALKRRRLERELKELDGEAAEKKMQIYRAACEEREELRRKLAEAEAAHAAADTAYAAHRLPEVHPSDLLPPEMWGIIGDTLSCRDQLSLKLALLTKKRKLKTKEKTARMGKYVGYMVPLKHTRVPVDATDSRLAGILKWMPELDSLDMSGCTRITDAGLAHVAKLGNLTTLDLYDCTSISDAGRKVLPQFLPQCEVMC